MSSAAAWIALGWAACATALGAIALIKRLRGMRRARGLASLEAPGGPCLLMRPCAGDEPTLLRCLVSVIQARRGFDLEVVMGVSSPDDTAVPAILRACEQLEAAGIPASLEVHPPRGPNRKAAILAGISAKRLERYDILLNADSNVDLAGYDIDALVAPLRRDPSLGATWAPPTELEGAVCIGNRASTAVLTGSLHAFGLLSGLDPAGLVGKLFAVRSAALRATGGFGELTDYLGEDAELSRRLRAAGSAVLPVAAPVPSLGRRCRFRDPVERHARWMAVIRAQRPGLLPTYPLFFFPTLFVAALAAVGALAAPLPATAALAVAILGRLSISVAAQRLSARRVHLGAALLDAVLGDAVLLLAFGRALRSTRFEWRGHRLRITRGGKLVADDGT